MVRQPAGGWKILADSWSVDQSVSAADSTARKAS
jgi:hypothetical protein